MAHQSDTVPYRDTLIEMELPRFMDVKRRAPHFLAKKRRELGTLSIDLNPGNEAVKVWMELLKAPIPANPLLITRIVRERSTKRPAPGWERIVETTNPVGQTNVSWGLELNFGTAFAQIMLMSQGTFIDIKEVWTKCIESIQVT